MQRQYSKSKKFEKFQPKLSRQKKEKLEKEWGERERQRQKTLDRKVQSAKVVLRTFYDYDLKSENPLAEYLVTTYSPFLVRTEPKTGKRYLIYVLNDSLESKELYKKKKEFNPLK